MKKEYDFKNAKRGQVVPIKGKTRITIYLDTDILEDFRERADKTGYGYQTMINEALREFPYGNGPFAQSLRLPAALRRRQVKQRPCLCLPVPARQTGDVLQYVSPQVLIFFAPLQGDSVPTASQRRQNPSFPI